MSGPGGDPSCGGCTGVPVAVGEAPPFPNAGEVSARLRAPGVRGGSGAGGDQCCDRGRLGSNDDEPPTNDIGADRDGAAHPLDR